eukprot:gene15746-18709_t
MFKQTPLLITSLLVALCLLATTVDSIRLEDHHSAATDVTTTGKSFYIQGDDFIKDGEAFQIISGSFHYFRCHPSLWMDRLTKMKAAGLNTVQTYIAWNVHQPTPDQFDLQTYNFTRFFEMAQSLDLLVIVRAGPYACGEWEFGGFPYWLISQHPEISLRSSDPDFLNAVDNWFAVLLPLINQQLYTNGGNVIMVQVENEYGSYGSDKAYLGHLLNLYVNVFGPTRGNGAGVIFHSTDGAGVDYLIGSQIAGVYQTVDFGPTDDPMSDFKPQRVFEPTGPLMNSEYYTGWLTHWQDPTAARVDAATAANGLYDILKLGASINMYMFYGGSNFAFMNGANGGDPSSFDITIQSYDYDAVLSEAGDITPKYLAISEAISKWTGVAPATLPSNSTKLAYGVVPLTLAASLFDNLANLSPNANSSQFAQSGRPLYFEEMDLAYGFALYETTINTVYQSNSLYIDELHDRATFYVNEVNQGFLQRPDNNSITVAFASGDTNKISILVENQGRVNYGAYLLDRKGLGKGVISSFQYIGPWANYPLALNDLSSLAWNPSSSYSRQSTPSFYRGIINIANADDIADTFLSFEGLGKGNLWVNGFNVGRYWNVGPQRTMYVPSVLLQVGANEIVVFETLGAQLTALKFVDEPYFD